ncbi:MAG: hypothetical protein JWQ81_4 [Amycolatopsis sp.]|uniref:hypothetical protein n=1 Tax=Amycolatopsis sp. TaxID=37632 RepID=UPI0026134668|nr:hypothetical protein [Amycolatopsis sp.]MCU1679265.1 hypothetical protein [Amycolatopsis sp.]
MSVRKLLLLTLAVCLIAAAGTVLTVRLLQSGGGEPGNAGKATTGNGKAVSTAPAFAYTTERQLVLMRGDDVLAKVSRPFDKADSAKNQVAWTADGNYVTMLAGAPLLQKEPDAEELITVDTRTGEQRRHPCPKCSTIVAAGPAGVLAGGDSGYLRFDLDRPGDGKPVDGLPVTQAPSFSPALLAGTEHLTLIREPTYAEDGTYEEGLTLSRPDGSNSVNAGFFESNDYMPVAAVGGKTERDTMFAVAARNNPGICFSAFPVYLIDAGGAITGTDLSAAAPPGFVANKAGGGMDVNDLWWDSERRLHASITSWTCDETKAAENEKEVPFSAARPWRLEGTKWVPEDPAPASSVRVLDQHSSLSLAIPDCVGPVAQPDLLTYCHTGKLDLVRDGARRTLADGVLAVYTAPVAAQAPPAQPVDIGRLAGAAVPGLCEHPAGTLVGGSLPGIAELEGGVQLLAVQSPAQAGALVAAGDLTGDGKNETAAVFGCSQGGVSWPNAVVVYSPDFTVMGAVDLGGLVSAEHSDVKRVEVGNGRVLVHWMSYEGAGTCFQQWTASIRWDGRQLKVEDQAETRTVPGC